ncbi:lipopolysaccharide kinase InaA family protein [Pontixanthobacter gangjinensis]|uniref:Kdo domain containing protein n=1 Tax=Christiangramia aestuarii TaxID=1028746 RepID=A0A7M3SXG8_9FLAO|nr:lipopolysaccharide kinase InaA family protein [Christiangramia aestuarii]MUP41299.1 Kdo domain containing protein [Christiangramia aestuarii]
MKFIFSDKGREITRELESSIKNFDSRGEALGPGLRNSLRIFEIKDYKVNIKSFKKPNLVNKLVYKYFRKSKAERSFRNAIKLLESNIGTPYPMAYAEENISLVFGRSYYACLQQDYDLTYRELVTKADYPDHENILRAFTRFTFELHENHVQFLDHSPGNTLIQSKGGDYKFFLVDLNRMNFKELNFEERMQNFSRLTPKKEMVKVMANEYSKLIGRPEEEVFEKMWFYTSQFQEKFLRKKRLKKKLKFWKK